MYDYVDAKLPVLRRMLAKRLKAYSSSGYEPVGAVWASRPARPAELGDGEGA